MVFATRNQLVAQTAVEIENLLGDMKDVTRIIERDPRVQSIMRTQYADKHEMSSDVFEISAMLSEFNQYYAKLFSMYFFSTQGASCESKYFTVKLDDLNQDSLFLQACLNKGTVWSPPQVGSLYAVTTGERLITMMTPVKELSSGKYQGAIVIELEEKRVQEVLDIGIGENGFLYICDENGHPVIMPNGLTAEYINQVNPRNTSTLVLSQDLDYCGWSVVGVIPTGDLLANSLAIVKTAVAACALVLALGAAVIYILIQRLLQPLNELNEKMGQVGSGDMTARTQIEEYNEIGAVMLRFNEMVEKIDDLMKKEAENQNKLRLMELTMLHEQIKPHFLYNTLDSLAWMARAGNDEGIIKMIMALTNFLKTGLNKGSDMILLEKEVEHTASYLYIQSIRYKNKFMYDISVDPCLMNYSVPKLIIQPLVENAIYHGIKEKRDLCHLSIHIWKAQGKVCIDIEDDGAGMTEEKAAMLREMLENCTAPDGAGFGVRNVNERIRIVYGPPYGVTFDTWQGEGSAFHITLPGQEEITE